LQMNSSPASTNSLHLDILPNLSSLLEPPTGATTNAPMEIPVEDIMPDPDQPRKAFDEDKLDELAESIRNRGVRSPISVRPHPGLDGKFIINYGERRYRASLLACKKTIPAWIQPDFQDEDQVIENIQRENLKPLEIAQFIGRKIGQGIKQKEIAAMLGKSKAWVSQYNGLLKLPGVINEAFKSERVTDVSIINDLVTIFGQAQETVTRWLASPSQEISRGTVRRLREFVDHQSQQVAQGATANFADPSQQPVRPTFRKPRLEIEVDGHKGQLVFNKRPTQDGQVWVMLDGEDEREVPVNTVRLLCITGK
jgi:ParB family transcriptional regulator, chromosome partitioning protein